LVTERKRGGLKIGGTALENVAKRGFVIPQRGGVNVIQERKEKSPTPKKKGKRD